MAVDQPANPRFVNPKHTFTNSGYLKLEWELPEKGQQAHDLTFEPRQADNKNFTQAATRYKDIDYATYISGLPDNTYYFRIRAIDDNQKEGNWSEAITVEVEHHSLKLALGLFSLGFLVFVATVGVVYWGFNQPIKKKAKL